MCGIVHTPVTLNSLVGYFPAIHSSIIEQFEQDCIEYHIPFSAAKFIMALAETQIVQGWETFSHIPFAIYEGGYRISTPFLEDLEADMFHIAMAQSLMYRLNAQLRARHGLAIILGHCCGADIAQARDATELNNAYNKSHELNVERGYKIRGLVEGITQSVSWKDFASKIPSFAWMVFDRCLDHQKISA